MIRIILFLCLCALSMISLKTHGQITVYQDEKGQVLTTIDSYASSNKALVPTHTRVTYMGSPFLTFPVWQKGKIRLDKHGQELTCELAYNLATNEVMCRLMGDSTVRLITPEVFTINSQEFVREQHKLPGLNYQIYSSVLYGGQTKLLTSMSSRVEEIYSNFYNRDIKGIYQTQNQYYIQKGNAEPRLINLSKKSLLDVFADQSELIDSKIPTKQLTTNDVINIINVYDSLVAVARANQAHLSKEDVFRQIFRNKITYPGWVGNQGIYGRVYAGFDIDSLGLVRNVVILSPDNIGFGFTYEVKKALETLANVDPNFRGRYALPVAFTYTNSKEKTGPHVPVNQLPDDRFENRTLLQEVVVPFVVTKPVMASREVWGYYK